MTTTTNTNGVIAAAAQTKPQEAPAKATPAQMLNSLLNNGAIQQALKSTLDKNAGAFAASVMNLFNNDTLLQQCEPRAVLAEALKAAALKLPVEKQLGFAYIIPYKDHGVPKPQFQLGYKGYIQLAMRTGEYRYINAGKVYEGELKSEDKLTGAVDISGERVSDKIIGYFAYIETLNGFSKTYYWSREKLTEHVKKYSKAFQKGSAIWRDNFDEMAIKTVLRNLLSHYGIMSIEMSSALSDEAAPGKIPGEPADGPEIIVDSDSPDESEEAPQICSNLQPRAAENNISGY